MLALALVVALAGADEFRLPVNITVAPSLLATVEDALRASPTLREQCNQIGRIRRVRVRLDVDAPEAPSPGVLARAYTTIRRYQFGSISADIHLWSTRDVASLLAHELEHVREFVEGIDYHAEAARDPHGVWKLSFNTFETLRAVRVSRTVANEIAASQRVAAAPGGQQ